jgi:hypothetical protein
MLIKYPDVPESAIRTGFETWPIAVGGAVFIAPAVVALKKYANPASKPDIPVT